MIKLFGLIARRPDLSRQEFHDHYRHPHGTLGCNNRRISGYVQCHQVDTPRLGGSQTRFEGVTELWFDGLDVLRNRRDDPYITNHVGPDEHRFADMEKVRFLLTREEVVISSYGEAADDGPPTYDRWLRRLHTDRPVTVKLLRFVSSDEDVDSDISKDGERAAALGAARYVRCYPDEDCYADEAISGGAVPEFTMVEELWWPTLTAFHEGTSEPRTFEDFMTRFQSSHSLVAYAERMTLS
jgi:hypothetical protein